MQVSLASETYIGENFLAEDSSMDVRTSRSSTETAPTVTAQAYSSLLMQRDNIESNFWRPLSWS